MIKNNYFLYIHTLHYIGLKVKENLLEIKFIDIKRGYQGTMKYSLKFRECLKKIQTIRHNRVKDSARCS